MFVDVTCLVFNRYPEHEQLQQIVQCYLAPVLAKQLSARHPIWSQSNKVHALAGSMVQVYEQVSSSSDLVSPPLNYFIHYNFVFKFVSYGNFYYLA